MKVCGDRVMAPAVAIILLVVVTLCGYLLPTPTTFDLLTHQAALELRADRLTSIMRAITWFLDPWRATILAIGIGATAYGLTKRWQWGLFITGSVALSAAFTALIKLVITRHRPPIGTRLTVEHSFSFPSGHSTAAAAFAISIACVVLVIRLHNMRNYHVRSIRNHPADEPSLDLYPSDDNTDFRASTFMISQQSSAFTILTWAFAGGFMVLIGLTRIYLAVHWVTDVLAGFTVGTATVLLLAPFLLIPDPHAPTTSSSATTPSTDLTPSRFCIDRPV